MLLNNKLLSNTENNRTSSTLTQYDQPVFVGADLDGEKASNIWQKKLDRLNELYSFLDFSHKLEEDGEIVFDKALVVCLANAVEELVHNLLEKEITNKFGNQLSQEISVEINKGEIHRFLTTEEFNEIIKKIESELKFKMQLTGEEELDYKEDIVLHTKIKLIEHLQNNEKLLGQSLDQTVFEMPGLSVRFKASCCYKLLGAGLSKIAAVDYTALKKLFEYGVLKDICWGDLNLLIESALDNIREPIELSGLPEEDRIHFSLIENFLKIMKSRENNELYRNIFLQYLDVNNKYLSRMFFEPISSGGLSFIPFESYGKYEDLRKLKNDLLKFSLENEDVSLLEAILELKVFPNYRMNDGDSLLMKLASTLKMSRDKSLLNKIACNSNTINFQNEEGMTALMKAACCGNFIMVDYLLNEKKAEISLIDKNGCDALILLMMELMKMNEHQSTQCLSHEDLLPYLDIVKLLINSGARIKHPELSQELQIEEIARKSQLKPLIELIGTYTSGKPFSGIQLA